LFFLPALNIFAQSLSPEEIRRQAQRLESGDAEAKRDALHRLRASESENASRIASGALDDKDEIVRATAPFSVLALPADEAAQRLLPLLKDKSEYVRREAAYALGETRSSAAVQPLLALLRSDKDYQVRCASVVALGKIGDVSAIESLNLILRQPPRDEEEFLRRAAARSIGQIAETALGKEFLNQSGIKVFNDFASQNRKNLVAEFPALRSSVAVLIRVLQNKEEADDAKREAAFALGEIGDAAAVRVLQSLTGAEDYYLAENSHLALKKILPAVKSPE
jgi:HEAT repeat protein